MSGEPPRYSAIIPAYNAARTIAATIGAILNQTLPPAEIIVIDDGSTDDTVAVASSVEARVRVVTQPNQGPGAATNRGAREASCPVLAFCDADDLWLETKIETQLSVLAGDPERLIVFGRVQHMRDADGALGKIQDGLSRTTMVLSATVFDLVGDVVDPPGGRGELVDWLARARETGLELVVVPQVLALRRIHAGSLSYGRDVAKDRGYLHVARQAMLRKRQAQGGEDT